MRSQDIHKLSEKSGVEHGVAQKPIFQVLSVFTPRVNILGFFNSRSRSMKNGSVNRSSCVNLLPIFVFP